MPLSPTRSSAQRSSTGNTDDGDLFWHGGTFTAGVFYRLRQ